MNCEQTRERIVDRWMRGIDEVERIEMEAHLAVCPSCKQETDALDPLWIAMGEAPVEEPGRHLRSGFHHMLEAYRLGLEQAAKPARAVRTPLGWLGGFWPRQVPAQAALAGLALVAGLTIGHLYTVGDNDRQKVSRLSTELQQMRHLVTLSLLQQQSATERLRGVNWSMQTSADDEVLEALLEALNSDQNVNVRLAAVDALKQFSTKVTVRRGLRESLRLQTSPLMQIALVDWAVESKDRGSVAAIEQLSHQPELNPAVKLRLQNALDQLRKTGMQ